MYSMVSVLILNLCVCVYTHICIEKNSEIYQQNCVFGRGVSGSVKFWFFFFFLLSEFSAIM